LREQPRLWSALSLVWFAHQLGFTLGEVLSGEMRNVVVTRVQHSGPARRSRNLEERLMVRFPSVYRRLAALVFRLLSPRSRLRRALLRRALLVGWGSFDRRDFELNLVLFAPDAEFEFPLGMQTLGLDGSFRGHAGRIEAFGKLVEVWGSSELEPAYMVDLGDRVLSLGFWHARARASAVQLEQEYSQLVTVRGGLITRDQSFFSWEEGLRAAGLDQDAIPLPSRGETRPSR
jgi:ketosteroid isomerase-like protein